MFTVQTALSVSVSLSLNKTAIQVIIFIKIDRQILILNDAIINTIRAWQPEMSFVDDESSVIFSAVGSGWESTVTNLLTAC